MKIEFEAKFYPVDKQKFIAVLRDNRATLVQSETKMTLVIFNKDQNPQVIGDYIRVRDEGNDTIRLSVKKHAVKGGDIADQKELDTCVEGFDVTVHILECAGLKKSGYQEKLRETWALNGAEVVIDTWPGLEPYIEIEADSEEKVKHTAELLHLDWNAKIITSVVEIYMEKYGLSVEEVLDRLRHATFENNPFTNSKK
jgi:adenylate cyclase class 2